MPRPALSAGPVAVSEADALAAALRAEYGFREVLLDPTPLGYSNRSHRVRADGKDAILRISFPGKTAAQVGREERLLSYLGRRKAPRPAVPSLITTRKGQPHFLRAGRRHHLFRRLPGEVRYRWRDLPSPADLRAAAAALAALHGALAPLSAPAPDPLTSLGQQLRRALAAPPVAEPLWPEAEPLWPAFERGARGLLRAARALPLHRFSAQWVQGDYQLENLLYDGRGVCGVLDFDDARPSLREVDLMLSLLSLARDGHRDDEFSYDRGLLDLGLRAYGAAAARLGLRLEEEALEPRHLRCFELLFCLEQCLLHLRSARRGQWRLIPGIGFWACYRGLACAAP